MVLKDDDGKYVVLEGNRRALGLKLLVNSNVLTSLKIASAAQRKLERLAKGFDRKTVEPIEAVLADGRTKPWLGVINATLRSRLWPLDFLRKCGDLTE